MRPGSNIIVLVGVLLLPLAAARRLVGLREHAQYATRRDQLQHTEVGLLVLERHGESRWQRLRLVCGEQVLPHGEDGQRARSRAEEAR